MAKIKVIATRKGYYGGYVRPASLEPFEVESRKHISKRWMLEVGTEEYDAYVRKEKGIPDAAEAQIVQEQLAAGGLQEQLSVTLTENQGLKARVAELEAELRVLKDRELATQEPSEDPSTPQPEDGEGEDGDAGPTPAEETEAKGRKRRRRS
jgi:hypothetical protein